MTEIALEMDHVYKKFRKGELFDSLRDLIPALTGRLFRGSARSTLSERDFWALQDVSFQVNHGEAFGVIGHNGAGKSTILKLLTGIMRPTRGTLSVHGRLTALIEVGAGFHPDLTGRENVFMSGAILGMTRQEIAQRFDQIVEFSGLDTFIDTPVKRYSSGMYARLGFSVAAFVEPDILIVDEVLSVGDFVFQQKCMERMSSVIRSGATVIFVSHNLRAVAELCGRSLLMDRGQAVANGPTDEIIRTYHARAESGRSEGLGRTGAFVSRVGVGDASGPRAHYISGERITVDVTVVSRGCYDRLAVVIGLNDSSDNNIFNVSTQSLTGASFSLSADQEITLTFDLSLHLAAGTYQFCTWLYSHDTETLYDRWNTAATILVSNDKDVRGVVNLNPTVHLGPKQPAPQLSAEGERSLGGSAPPGLLPSG